MPEGDIAVNPQTGERRILRGGQWVPEGAAGQAPGPAPMPMPQGQAPAPGIRFGQPPARQVAADERAARGEQRAEAAAERDAARFQRSMGTFERLSPEDARAEGLDPTRPWQRGPDGKIEALGGTDRPFTDGERNAAMFAYRAYGANERMNELAQQRIYKPSSPSESLFNVDRNGAMRLVLRTEQDRLFFQTAKDWLAPILRKDTGAAVTDQELITYMDMYIPRYEDEPSVIYRKAEARADAMRALYGSARRAYDSEYGAPSRQPVLAPSDGRPKGRPAPKPLTDGGQAALAAAQANARRFRDMAASSRAGAPPRRKPAGDYRVISVDD